jgi:hypothetical protein
MNQFWSAKRKSAKFLTRLFCALLATGLFWVGLLAPAATPASAAAGINSALNFQGRLLNSAGAVVADGSYNMQFKLYQDGPGNVAGDTGGTLMWTESWVYGVNTPDNRVTVKNGYFSIPLGTICAFTATTCTASTGNAQTNTVVDFNQDTLWLSMNIENTAGATALCSGFASGSPASCTGGDGEMLPMRRLSSSVYALNAGKLGGLTSAGFIQNQAASPQTANFNLLSGAATTVAAAQIQTVGSATAPVLVLKGGATPGVGGDLLQLQSSAAAVLFRVDSTGVLGSPNVSTASTNSAGTTLQTGNSSTSGNTGILTLATGNAASGNSGNITIGTGTATGTAGSVIVKNLTNTTTALQVQNAAGTPLLTADTTNGKIDIFGTQSTPPLGATLLANGNFATNSCASWTCGAGWAADTGAAVHTAGNTAALSQSITVASGTTYQIDFTQSGATTGTLTLAIGSQTLDIGYWDDPDKTIVANASGSQTFSITPTTDYNGTLDNITVKAITGTALAVQRILNSDGTVGLEVRSGGSGLNNSFIGINSGQFNTTGYENTANGAYALQYNTTGGSNTANGAYALRYNTTGLWNTANGASALQSNTTGGSNTANGASALQSNTTGSENTANGVNALRYNQTGAGNTALGYRAGYGVPNNSFDNNSLFGFQSGLGLTTGSNNVLLGYNAGQNLTTGANNIVLGYNINAPAATSANTLNIGNMIYGTGINGSGSTLSTGNIGIGTTSPSNTLQVIGSICAKSTNAACAANVAGRIYASNTTVAAADLAENYVSGQVLEPGDVITPEGSGNNQAVVKTTAAHQTQAIGVISTDPGVTLNSDAAPDAAHPHVYPVALSGRVPVKVTAAGRPIAVGDQLTTASTPGYAMKATQAGRVIGTALEPLASGTGKIMVFVDTSYFDPTAGNYIQGGGDAAVANIMVTGSASAGSLNISGEARTAKLTVIGSASIGGDLTVAGSTLVMDLTVKGHIITVGNTPSVNALTAAGQHAVVTVQGNDTRGVITIMTGDPHQAATATAPEAPAPASGDVAKVTFAQEFGTKPFVMLSPSDKDSTSLQSYPSAIDTKGFTLGISGSPQAQKSYRFNYWIVQ